MGVSRRSVDAPEGTLRKGGHTSDGSDEFHAGDGGKTTTAPVSLASTTQLSYEHS